MYTRKDMEDCFTAGVNFARDIMNNPSNSEYIEMINKEKETNLEQNSIKKPNCDRCDGNPEGIDNKLCNDCYIDLHGM